MTDRNRDNLISTPSTKVRVALITLFGAVLALLTTFTAYATRELINAAVGQGSLTLSEGIVMYAVVLAAMIVTNALFSFMTASLSVDESLRLRKCLINCTVTKKLADIATYHSADIVNRATDDVSIYVRGLVEGIPAIINCVLRIVTSLVLLFYMDAMFGWIVTAALPVAYIASVLYGKRVSVMHRDIQYSESDNRAFMAESVQNNILIRANSNLTNVNVHFDSLQKHNRAAKMKLNKLSITMNLLMIACVMGIYFVALGRGASRLSEGTLAFGTMLAVLQLVLQFQNPVKSLPGLIGIIYKMRTSGARIREIFDLPQETDAPGDEINVGGFEEIVLSDVTYSYDGNVKVFEHINATVRKGSVVGLSGRSGAGKTTLIKVMMGLMPPTSGSVSVRDERGVSAVSASLFAYVPQGNMLLSATVRDNITFFDDRYTDEQIYAVLDTCCLRDVIESMPDSLDSVLGERGYGLSEGQLQRLAVSRALLLDRPILILDEASSALDADTERAMIDNILKTGKTIIMATHHKYLLDGCDYTIKL